MNLKQLLDSRALAFCCVLVVVLLLAACGGRATEAGDPPPPPPPPPLEFSYAAPQALGDGWTVAHAADLGVDVAELEAMMRESPSRFGIVDAIAVAYQGQLIFDETLRTGTDFSDERVANTDPDLHALYSVSKSLASLAIGIAIDEGLIGGVDVPFLSLFPYPDYANPDSRKDDIRLHHVLTMQLGIEWDEWNPPYSAEDNQLNQFIDNEVDFAKALLDLPMFSAPGTTWQYTTPASTALGQAIENAGPLTLVDFGGQHVFGPLGISRVEVVTTPTGLPDLGRGLYFTARDLLKFGQLYADGGTWNGTRVVSQDWIDASVTRRVELEWRNPEIYDWQIDGYGYQWWTGHYEIDGEVVDTYAGLGFGDQVLMVVPALDLVAVVYASNWDEREERANQVFDLILNRIIAALPETG